MEMQEVESSNVHAIGYDEASQTLQVQFNNGATYQYFDVPSQLFEGLISAESVGGFLNANIKDSYRYSRV